MLKIGITGGIGSGKSLVAHIFRVLGIPVFDADETAKKIMNEDKALKAEIIQQFGQKAYKAGVIDRKYLADLVFKDPFQLEKLNAIVHPVTIRAAQNWMKKQDAPYALKEAALLFESGTAADLDYVIGVYAPAPLRTTRVMRRNNIAMEEVKNRMKRQINEEIKMKLCDFVIVNDEQTLLIPQVIMLHQKIMEKVK
jgi:dephospho-CoA kinase